MAKRPASSMRTHICRRGLVNRRGAVCGREQTCARLRTEAGGPRAVGATRCVAFGLPCGSQPFSMTNVFPFAAAHRLSLRSPPGPSPFSLRFLAGEIYAGAHMVLIDSTEEATSHRGPSGVC
ncbi:hypothetical protein CUR178_06092 [Leishmania enriettii]|uniref:Uncharacterized protein n=1 Tax=Leishmania enriettii TaxID=5663 RepID=A0A836GHQ3_LEIEN|nr:hypothetical protein CUR178_06092 [Leishmania enriettii]